MKNKRQNPFEPVVSWRDDGVVAAICLVFAAALWAGMKFGLLP